MTEDVQDGDRKVFDRRGTHWSNEELVGALDQSLEFTTGRSEIPGSAFALSNLKLVNFLLENPRASGEEMIEELDLLKEVFQLEEKLRNDVEWPTAGSEVEISYEKFAFEKSENQDLRKKFAEYWTGFS